MKILTVGCSGQVASSLFRRAQVIDGVECVALGRPRLDIADPDTIRCAIEDTKPDVVVNAAAYTAVDLAESEREQAFAINADGPGALARITDAAGVPIIHISTDYVFDGAKAAPYLETDATNPQSVYGESKLAGEQAVADSAERFVILRTAWVVSPFGKNFVKTMLRLAAERDTLTIVADQHGSPTSALDIADGVLNVAHNIISDADADLFGVFHMTNSGYAVWADLAEHVFAISGGSGGPMAKIERITTAEYPTPAKRPQNSCLDCSKIRIRHGIELPDWHESVETCVRDLLR